MEIPNLQESVQMVQERLTKLRKVSALPWWRCTYAEFLVERTRQYVALGSEKEARKVLERLYRWLNIQENAYDSLRQKNWDGVARPDLSAREADLVRSTGERLLAGIRDRGNLVPGPERESLKLRVQKALQLLERGQGNEASREVRLARLQFIRRLQRSYRARALHNLHKVQEPRQAERRTRQGPVGPYNNRYCLEDLLQLVGERDPIWVEDFLETYDNLMQYGLKLGESAQPQRKR